MKSLKTKITVFFGAISTFLRVIRIAVAKLDALCTERLENEE